MAQANTKQFQDKAKSKHVISLKDLWPFLKPYRLQVGIAFVLLCLASAT